MYEKNQVIDIEIVDMSDQAQGIGKAKEIAEAVRKGIEKASKELVAIRRDGDTMPHPVTGEFGAARVLLKPAPAGTGVIAGGVVRAIMELGGVKDVVTKVVGRTSNAINVAWATLEAIKETRTADEIYKLRGKKALEAAPVE